MGPSSLNVILKMRMMVPAHGVRKCSGAQHTLTSLPFLYGPMSVKTWHGQKNVKILNFA